MKRVQQEETFGCAVASLAMVLGVTYREARALLPAANIDSGGIGVWWTLRVAAERGWAYAERWEHYAPEGRKREVWPPAPFAPVHICGVVTRANTPHAVVMLADGAVLDPWREGAFTLADYAEVHEVAGLWKVT